MSKNSSVSSVKVLDATGDEYFPAERQRNPAVGFIIISFITIIVSWELNS